LNNEIIDESKETLNKSNNIMNNVDKKENIDKNNIGLDF
jgi:hypothetical protein